MYEIFDNLLKLSGVSASVSSASSVSNSASETTSKSVYSDSMIDVEFKGLSNQSGLDGELFIGLTVNFNPRSRVGSDVVYLIKNSKFSLFQSTLPCRERPKLVCS